MKLKGGKICSCPECAQDHCSLLCRQDWYVEKRRRKLAKERMMKIMTAEIKECHCGVKFVPRTWNQLSCSPECSHRARKAA